MCVGNTEIDQPCFLRIFIIKRWLESILNPIILRVGFVITERLGIFNNSL